MEPVKLVMVGHVDHGKSTLIGRLFLDTGSLPHDMLEELKKQSTDDGHAIDYASVVDSLQEEREQGITIDTTQRFFSYHERDYVIIDAPGHVEFIKNMITGASQADAAVLIVDASLGWQEQSGRHAYILSLLGITQVIVVLNKMDLIDFNQMRFEELKQVIATYLATINISAQAYIPISAIQGDNIVRPSTHMPWYKDRTVCDALNACSVRSQPMADHVLFPVQDVYTVGSSKVSVGRVEAGSLRVNQPVRIFPERHQTSIRTIQKFNQQLQTASKGESIGITTDNHRIPHRGHVVCDEAYEPLFTDIFAATVFWFGSESVVCRERITIRCSTQEIWCCIEAIKKRIDSSTIEVIEYDADRLHELDIGKVTVRLEHPIIVQPLNQASELGRFVLIRNGHVCAAGMVTGIEDQTVLNQINSV
ncbi:MAG: adenylyl-sulfate kinase [Elusimicrobia bacterium]|nr:adenylyl-sulfate kinase [Elusimicrobiota bacterium]MBD3411955.1 adenylyl-sulfate kinase [Elusimicrobiota bacterium]